MEPLSNEALTFLISALIEDLDARDRAAGRRGVAFELLHMIKAFQTVAENITPPLKNDHGAAEAAALLRWLQAHQHPKTAHPPKRS